MLLGDLFENGERHGQNLLLLVEVRFESEELAMVFAVVLGLKLS